MSTLRFNSILVFLTLLSGLIHGQSNVSNITIANIGPQDARILPVIIGTEQHEILQSSDSLMNFIYKLSIIVVSKDVYAFTINYLKKHKMKLNSNYLNAVEASPGSIAIYENNDGNRYCYMSNYRKPSLVYLNKFIKALEKNATLAYGNKHELIEKIKGFIKSHEHQADLFSRFP